MLYTSVTNDWGETTYIPTTLGNVLLVIILAALCPHADEKDCGSSSFFRW